MKKRVLSVLLAIVMVVGLFPVTAGATTAEPVKTWEIGASESGKDAVVAKLYTNAADNTKYDLVISGTGEMDSTHGTSMPWTYDSTYQEHIVSVTVESGVTNVESYAFKDCTALTSVTIGDTVTEIGSFAFDGCTALTSVTLGASVTEIWGYAFGGCTSLTAYTVDSENTAYSATDGILFSKDGTTLVSYPSNKSGTSYTVPDSVTKISSSAFCDVINLTELTIPHTTTTIVGTIFYGKAFEGKITIKGHTGSAAEDYTEWDSDSTTFVSICSDGDDADTLCDVCGYDPAHAAHPVCGDNECSEHGNDVTFEPWTATDSLPTSGSYYLTVDVTLSAIYEPSGTVNLCLNGHTVSSTWNSNVIYVESGNTLNICDCTGTGKITSDHSAATINVEGTASLHSGTVENKNSNGRPGIALNSGSLTVTGGTVTSSNGSGIGVYGGTLILSGAPAISGATADFHMMGNDSAAITIDGSLNNVTPYSVRFIYYDNLPSTIVSANATDYSGNFVAANSVKYGIYYDSTSQCVKLAERPSSYTVTFNANGGTCETASAETVDGKLATLPDATRVGYIFNGWFDAAEGENKITTETEFTTNKTVYAQWTAYAITQQPTVDNEYEVIVNPSANVAYTWHEITETPVTTDNADIYVDAGFSSSYTAEWWSCHSTEGTGTPGYFSTDLGAGDTVEVELSRACEGTVRIYYYYYDGTVTRYQDYEETNGGNKVSLVAPAAAKYDLFVSVRDDGEQPTVKAKIIKAGEAISGQTTNKLTDGTDGTNYVAKITYPDGAVLTSEAVCYVSPSFEVTFDANGGTTVSKQTVDNGGKVEEPAAPTKTGYTFAGWYKDSELATAWDFDTDTVTEPTTLYAKWTANTNTPYEVRYFTQTLAAAKAGNTEENDTNYTLADSETYYGTSDDTVWAERIDIEGFTKPDGKMITVSPDGTTVYDYYYARNKYGVHINDVAGISSVSGAGNYFFEEEVTISAEVEPGYKWIGWAGSINATEQTYTFTMWASGGITLTPQLETKADVIIDETAQFADYDGTAKTFRIISDDALEGFTIAYEQNGQAVTPINAGFYDVVLSRAEDDTYKAYSKTLASGLIINKVVVDEPNVGDKPYNGSVQTAHITDTAIYEVTENAGGTDVGTYDVILTLKDTVNYKWRMEENSGATATRKFYITFTENAWDAEPQITGWTYGQSANAPTFDAKFGEVVVEYKKTSEDETAYTTDAPVNAGNYNVRLTVTATTNFGGLSKVINLNIAKATPSLEAPTAQNSITYGAELNTVELTDGWTWLDGDTTPTVVNSGYTAYYTPADTENYDWTVINGWNATESRVEHTVAVTVTKNNPSYEAPTGLTATYGDTLADVTLPDGWSWKDSTLSVGNAGTQTFVAVFTPSDTNNYNSVEENITITVAKKEIAEPAVSGSYTYTGNEQTVTLIGVESFMTVSGNKATNAGNYVVTVTLDDNHKWNASSDGEIEWSIAKADMSADITASGYNAVFDNQAHTIRVNIPEGASIKYGITEGTYNLDVAPEYTNAGTYTVYYKVEKPNYNDVTGSADVVIDKKDIMNAEITLGEALTFDGNEQTQAIASATVDGLTITYDVSGNVNTNAGDYTLTITGNGNFEGTAQKTYTIAKATPSVSAPTAKTGLVYNGADKALVSAGTTIGGEMQYSLDGTTWSADIPAGTNANTYTVYYKVVGDANHDDNAGGSVSVTIGKAYKTAPEVAGVDETIKSKANGRITGVDDTMEYKKQGDAHYIAITADTVENLAAGTYLVRYKETENYFASSDKQIVIADGVMLTIAFNSNEGTSVDSVTCEWNQTITAPTEPTKDGFEFISWYLDDTLTTKWTNEYQFTADTTLYAKWVQGTVSDHEDHVDEIEADGLNDVAKAEETDIKLVVQVEEATEGDSEQTAIKGIADAPNNFGFYDITLEKSSGGYVTNASSVIEIKLPYDFTRKTNIKVYRYHSGVSEELAQLDAKATAPYVDGKSYVDKSNNCIYIYSSKFSTYAVAYDTVRSSSGGGTTRYTVKFDTDGGSSISNATVNKNAKVTEPKAPEKDGYTFGGWYTDEELTEKYDFESKVTKNFTLFAKWDKHDDEQSGTDTHNCPSLAFDDLDITKWYHFDTDYVIENGIFKGTTETTFEPDSAQTRAMMVTVLYRVEGEPAVNKSIPFADVDMGAYYANAVIWGQQNGIIKGYSETEFGPDDKITREQIAAIMHRYAQYKGIDVSVGENTNILSYDDFDSISEYAIAAMQWACGSGLIKGRTESTLNPLDNATRVEIAAILHRFIEVNK